MLMKAKGYKAGYLNEYLAIGEAPEEVRNVFRQRSRWCKGQMQVSVHADDELLVLKSSTNKRPRLST
jgi:cellulose synthase/poly-beta-1,6-N-acetylglucosamine synthase-like glycosyltransferase